MASGKEISLRNAILQMVAYRLLMVLYCSCPGLLDTEWFESHRHAFICKKSGGSRNRRRRGGGGI